MSVHTPLHIIDGACTCVCPECHVAVTDTCICVDCKAYFPGGIAADLECQHGDPRSAANLCDSDTCNDHGVCGEDEPNAALQEAARRRRELVTPAFGAVVPERTDIVRVPVTGTYLVTDGEVREVAPLPTAFVKLTDGRTFLVVDGEVREVEQKWWRKHADGREEWLVGADGDV